MNRPPTPDVLENAPEREPTLQELINIKVKLLCLLLKLFFVLSVGFVSLLVGELHVLLAAQLIETGEKERLMELLRERLVDCGWKDEMKALCR